MAQNPSNLQNRQQKGTGFTNLNKIIGVNQNNRLGQAIGSGINQQVNQGRQATNQAQQQFQEQSEAARIDTDANKQKVQNTLGAPNVEASDQDVKDFQTFRSGRYGGPTELQDQQRLQGQAQSTQSVANLGSTSGGRQSLLQRFVGGEGYSQGKQRLDNLLLGQSGNDQLRDARRDATGLVQDVNKATTAAGQRADLLSNQAKQFAQDVDQQIDTRRTGIDTDINTRLSQTQALEGEKKTAFDALAQQINSGQLGSQEALNTLAGSNLLNAEQKKNLLDVYNQSLNSGVGADKALKDAMSFQQAQNVNYLGVAQNPELQSINALRRLKNEFEDYNTDALGADKYIAGAAALDKTKAQGNIDANAVNLANLLGSNRGYTAFYDDSALFDKARAAGMSDEYIRSLVGDDVYNMNMRGGGGAAKAMQSGVYSAAGLGQGNTFGSPGTYGTFNGQQLSQYDPLVNLQSTLDREYNADLSRSPTSTANTAANQARINAIADQAAKERSAYETQSAANQTALQNLMNTLGVTDYTADTSSPSLQQQNLNTRLALLRNQAADAYSGVAGDANSRQSVLDLIKGITG